MIRTAMGARLAPRVLRQPPGISIIFQNENSMRNLMKPAIACALICGALNVAVAAPKFVYTVSTDQTVRSFSVNAAKGTLLPLPGGTRTVDEFPFGFAASSDGTLLYSVNPNSNNIAAFKADPSSGSLLQAPGSPYLMPAGSSGAVRMVVHPNSKFAYANAQTGDISSFLVNPANAALTPFGNVVQAGISATMHIVASGNFLYAVNGGLSFLPDPARTNNISAFKIETNGSLTELPGSPFATCTGPRRVTSDPAGKFLLVSCTDSKTIQVHKIQADGALTGAGNALRTSGSNFDIAVEPSGRFAYVTFGDLQRVFVYSLNQNTGALARLTAKDVKTNGAPRYICIDGGGRMLFVQMFASNKSVVAAYTIDAASGGLTLSGSSTTSASGFPEVGMSLLSTAQ
jgi:6-phosphogluconolactonase (cycloisomerase 2 family)